ncbi:hypothetical protein SISSUDRAFT_734280 [Sistotremastrum suecicum HHB10207 ss-3]|uniref:F-box domain-containing protein n=1 Tax=Sistotremastrum suecicum HHB10207 ss-3 TaxID=1314776 RepID=A0A166DG67_9AGAM|nr:hypothetical protein SISSUDRAFT_734280 [Sistotremastrum suecicum HHB10207 ss-3]
MVQASISELLHFLSPEGEALRIFPSLKGLMLDEPFPMRYPIILPLLHDGLKALSLRLSHSDYCKLVVQIFHKTPNLERIELWDGYGFDIAVVNPTAPPIAHAIRPLSSLRSVYISPILLTLELMDVLSSRPCLNELSTCSYRFHIRHRNVHAHGSVLRPIPKFPQLTDLYIDSIFLMGFGQGLFQASNLRALIVTFMDGTLDLAGTATELISVSFPQLKNLAIEFPEPRISAGPMPATLTIDAINPLLRLEFLEVLIIEHPRPPRIDDHALERVAIRLPHLRCFQLCARAFKSADYELPTLRCLLPFAQHCRELITFGISLNASIVLPPIDCANVAFSHSLKTVILYSSRIGNETFRVVNFLSSILPPQALLRHLVSPREMFIEGQSRTGQRWGSVDHFSEESSVEEVRQWSTVAAALVLLKHGSFENYC